MSKKILSVLLLHNSDFSFNSFFKRLQIWAKKKNQTYIQISNIKFNLQSQVYWGVWHNGPFTPTSGIAVSQWWEVASITRKGKKFNIQIDTVSIGWMDPTGVTKWKDLLVLRLGSRILCQISRDNFGTHITNSKLLCYLFFRNLPSCYEPGIKSKPLPGRRAINLQ